MGILYGPDGHTVVAGKDPVETDLRAVLERYAAEAADLEHPEVIIERAQSLLTVGLMLVNYIAAMAENGQELAQSIWKGAQGSASRHGPAMRCTECGCTALQPCSTQGKPCGWAGPHLCTACAAKLQAQLDGLPGALGAGP